MSKTKAKFSSDTSRLGRIAITVTMIVLTISFLYPLIYLLLNSFKDTTEYYLSNFALPKSLSLVNYRVMLIDFQIMNYFGNSLIIAVGCTSLILFFAIFASYAFAKIPFRGRSLAYMLILATMFMPGQATIIPQYVMFSKYRLINSYWSVILAGLAGGLPGAIMLLRAAFMGVPNEMLESGRIDGAGYFTMVFRLTLPVSMATLSIVTITNFISHWNDLLTPMLFLTDRSKQTIMVALTGMVGRYADLPTRELTGILLSVLPTVAIYLLLQKYMIKGVMVGSLKA